ncbi:hypothetical protein SO802_011019 [Lithocarpus litseifolius]|uniref:Uncharacterized protein n=1 Tax=Lithocarpus litseifolius TaxID=425828 RepID=A0AAW2DFU9_9ROSI
MHSSELDEDFGCKQGAPQKAVKKSGILGHVAQFYTCKIFNLFENKFLNSLAMVWDQVDCQDTTNVFEVKEENSERVRIVRFDHLNNNISYSCFTNANLYSQSYSPWTMHSQDMSYVNVPFTSMLQGTEVVAQLSQNSSTSQMSSLIYNSKQPNYKYSQEVVNHIEKLQK